MLRRQELPAEAFIDPAEVATVDVIAVSYCWNSSQHPDPNGYHFRILGGLLESYCRGRARRGGG